MRTKNKRTKEVPSRNTKKHIKHESEKATGNAFMEPQDTSVITPVLTSKTKSREVAEKEGKT